MVLHSSISTCAHAPAQRCAQRALPACAGPRALRGVDPRLLAALHQNPALLHALLSGARGQAAPPSGWGGHGEEEGEEQEVSCRMA